MHRERATALLLALLVGEVTALSWHSTQLTVCFCRASFSFCVCQASAQSFYSSAGEDSWVPTDTRHQTGTPPARGAEAAAERLEAAGSVPRERYMCCSFSVSPERLLLKSILSESKFREILFLEEFADNPRIEVLCPQLSRAQPLEYQ